MPVTIMQTLEHPKIKDWLAECRTPKTCEGYGFSIQKFFKWYGKPVDQFLNLPANEKRHAALCFQNESSNAPNTINSTLAALNSFLDCYDMKINFKGKRIRKTMDLNSHNFSNGDLAKMFEVGNTKEKCMLALATSLGWEVSAVLSLKRAKLQSYVERAKSEGKQYFYFKEQRQKTGVPRLGILNPLCLKWLARWLEESKNKRPRKRWGVNPDPKSDLFDTTTAGANKLIRKLADEAHLKKTGRVHFHKLRSWVMSGLSRGGMNAFEVKYAVGKAIPMSDFTYLQTIQESIEQKYPEIYESYLNLETPSKAISEIGKALEEKTVELDKMQAKLEALEESNAKLVTFMADFQKAFASYDGTRTFQERFKEATRERERNERALKDYITGHPERQWRLENPNSAEKLLADFKEYGSHKKKEARAHHGKTMLKK